MIGLLVIECCRVQESVFVFRGKARQVCELGLIWSIFGNKREAPDVWARQTQCKSLVVFFKAFNCWYKCCEKSCRKKPVVLNQKDRHRAKCSLSKVVGSPCRQRRHQEHISMDLQSLRRCLGNRIGWWGSSLSEIMSAKDHNLINLIDQDSSIFDRQDCLGCKPPSPIPFFSS